MIDAKTLERLRNLEKAATPGPWPVQRNGWFSDCGVDSGSHGHPGPFAEPGVCENRECPTCRLISESRAALPDLLRLADAVPALIDALDEIVGDGPGCGCWASPPCRGECHETVAARALTAFQEATGSRPLAPAASE